MATESPRHSSGSPPWSSTMTLPTLEGVTQSESGTFKRVLHWLHNVIAEYWLWLATGGILLAAGLLILLAIINYRPAGRKLSPPKPIIGTDSPPGVTTEPPSGPSFRDMQKFYHDKINTNCGLRSVYWWLESESKEPITALKYDQPWFLRIFSEVDFVITFHCSGVLVGADWVLTVSGCAERLKRFENVTLWAVGGKTTENDLIDVLALNRYLRVGLVQQIGVQAN